MKKRRSSRSNLLPNSQGDSEVKEPWRHGHFEAYDKAGGHVIENTFIEVVP